MQPSILKSVLFVALGITSAAAESFSATHSYKCCTQEDCTDCTTGNQGDGSSCPMCESSPGRPGEPVSSPSPKFNTHTIGDANVCFK